MATFPRDRRDPAPATPNLDAAADKKGRTQEIRPERDKRLLELKGELEHATGEERARLQSEIDAMQGG
jgi:hypothetical protein